MVQLNIPSNPMILNSENAKAFVKAAKSCGTSKLWTSAPPLSSTYKELLRKVARREHPLASSEELANMANSGKHIQISISRLNNDVYVETDWHPLWNTEVTTVFFSPSIGLSRAQKARYIAILGTCSLAAVSLLTAIVASLPSLLSLFFGVSLILGAGHGIHAMAKSFIAKWKNAAAAHLDKIAAGLEVAIKNVLPKTEVAAPAAPSA